MTVRYGAYFFEIDGKVLGGMQFGVLAQVLFWAGAVDGAGCCWRCLFGDAVRALVRVLSYSPMLFGV